MVLSSWSSSLVYFDSHGSATQQHLSIKHYHRACGIPGMDKFNCPHITALPSLILPDSYILHCSCHFKYMSQLSPTYPKVKFPHKYNGPLVASLPYRGGYCHSLAVNFFTVGSRDPTVLVVGSPLLDGVQMDIFSGSLFSGPQVSIMTSKTFFACCSFSTSLHTH